MISFTGMEQAKALIGKAIKVKNRVYNVLDAGIDVSAHTDAGSGWQVTSANCGIVLLVSAKGDFNRVMKMPLYYEIRKPIKLS